MVWQKTETALATSLCERSSAQIFKMQIDRFIWIAVGRRGLDSPAILQLKFALMLPSKESWMH
jgi:hypothetical protein